MQIAISLKANMAFTEQVAEPRSPRQGQKRANFYCKLRWKKDVLVIAVERSKLNRKLWQELGTPLA